MTVADSPTTPLDVNAILADFPLLLDADGNRPYTFLDTAASAQKPRQVLDAVREVYESHYANVHRGVYKLGNEATERYEAVRGIVARHLTAPSPREIIFTRGTTEAVNLVAYGWGLKNLGPGDIVISTMMEHHANFVPWQQVAKMTGAEFRVIPCDNCATLELDDIDELAAGGAVKMVAVGHISNTTGTINPVQKLARWAHDLGALVFVDGAQAAPHRQVDVGELEADFYAFSGHKALGPTGAGALWGRAELLNDMNPFMYGGEMITEVTQERSTWNELPWKFEAGTPAFCEVVGLGAALTYLNDLGWDAIHEHEQALTAYAFDRLDEIEGLQVMGPPREEERAGILPFMMTGTHPHDIASVLDRDNVCVRAGMHCTHPLHEAIGASSTARASFYVYNDAADIDRLIDALVKVREIFPA